MEAEMKCGFGFNTQSLPSPEDNIPKLSPILSTLLPFPQDYYLSVGTTPFSQLPPLVSNKPQPGPLQTPVLNSKKKGREKISDRTRTLQKLMPVNKRMKTADMLEEAYKYVKFLQAQVRALYAMPLVCSDNVGGGGSGGEYGVLGLLNRQQLLQVILNSPSVQTNLYSQGLCVSSLDHLLAFVGTHANTN